MNSVNNKQTILVTGAAGMIGSATVRAALSAGYRVIGVDIKEFQTDSDFYRHYVSDLSDVESLKKLMDENHVDKVVHLAALAHTINGKSYSWEDYKHLNVQCAENVFKASGNIPVLFISTIDVYGFTKQTVNAQTGVRPVSLYAKSKAIAEKLCEQLPSYTIFRFSPVYTEHVKRDIQKRYYLKYPRLAYRIGKGTEYEILNIHNAVNAIVEWCDSNMVNEIRIIKDPQRMKACEYIQAEKKAGRARFVLVVPKWFVSFSYTILKALTGENHFTYLLHKAVYPLRSE